MATRGRASIADLLATSGKAELVGGELLVMSPTGYRPGRASGKIFASLLRQRNGGRQGDRRQRRLPRRPSTRPTLYRRGETAEGEPAVPGWRMPVDELFD